MIPAGARVALYSSQSLFGRRVLQLIAGSQHRPITQAQKWMWRLRDNHDDPYVCVARWLASCPFFVELQKCHGGILAEEHRRSRVISFFW